MTMPTLCRSLSIVRGRLRIVVSGAVYGAIFKLLVSYYIVAGYVEESRGHLNSIIYAVGILRKHGSFKPVAFSL
jgi:hypothetical protein